MKRFLEQVREIGYERPRAAIALLPLSLFAFMYFFGALSSPPEWKGALIGLSACYLVAFLAIASEWFWARWFAGGLGWSGLMVGIVAMLMIGWQPALAIYGGLHAIVVLMLLGPKMAARYDLQPGWRARFGMDEFGVIRLRKAVTRASAALPSLIIWALGPREGDGQTIALVAGAFLAVLGIRGLVRARTWGVLALAAASLAVLFGGNIPLESFWQPSLLGAAIPFDEIGRSPGFGGALAILLAAAAMPFAGSALRYYRSLK
jgi:hypothetical protein